MPARRIFVAVLLAACCSLANATDPNLLPNGDFSDIHQLIGWTNLGPEDIEFNGGIDATGGGVSGSMELHSLGTNIPTTAVSSCFAVSPGAAYVYGGYAASSGFATSSTVYFACRAYPTPDCSGNSFLQLATTTLQSSVFAPFPAVSGSLPENAASADCRVSVATTFDEGISTASIAVFDDLFFDSPAPPPASVHLDGYMSGNWYDPTQSGQGFQLEFTDQNNTLLAIWFVYTPDGSAQNWIYAQGEYDLSKSSVTVPAEILSGAKFPPLFNATDIAATPWGTITFAFTDCNHGTATWNSTVPGYGSGSQPITRLTRISGTACPAGSGQ